MMHWIDIKQVAAYLAVGNSEDTVIITVDDDCHYSLNLVESLVRCERNV